MRKNSFILGSWYEGRDELPCGSLPYCLPYYIYSFNKIRVQGRPPRDLVAEKDRVSRGLVQRLRVSGTWSDGRVLI